MAPKPQPVDQRFALHVSPEPNTGCWLRIGREGRDGYGRFYFQRTTRLAHRVSWMLSRGEIPPGLCVLHKCDVPLCVNPEHLFLGTLKDNTHDMWRKGRHSAKLSRDQVLAIRKDQRTHSKIAADHSVTPAQISHVKALRAWAHIQTGDDYE